MYYFADYVPFDDVKNNKQQLTINNDFVHFTRNCYLCIQKNIWTV